MTLYHILIIIVMQEAGQQKTDFPEGGSAMLLTIERTQIHACSSNSLVTKGTFTG